MNCKKAKKLGILFWEQSKTCQEELDLHWQNCPECGASFQNLAKVLKLCRQNLQLEEKPEDFSHYWSRLCRSLVKPAWSEKMGQKIKDIFALVSRSIWGPVPAYAVAAVLILITAAVFPLSKGTRPLTFQTLPAKYSLVIGQHELTSATSQGGLTVYAMVKR